MRRSVSDSSVSRTLDLPPAERAATRATERATETGAAARAEAGEIATGISGWCCRADGRADVSESGVQLRADSFLTGSSKCPSMSVVTALVVPSIATVTPIMGSWSPLSKTFPSITPCLTAISVWVAAFPFTFCACIEARDGGVRQQPSKIQRQALGVN